MQSPNPNDSSQSNDDAQRTQLPIEISVVETSELISSGKPLLLIDCREADEVATCAIEGAVHIPMQDIPQRISEIKDLAPERLIIHCHHGGRSLNVAAWLRENSFPQAQNMTGGIEQWSLQIDPEVPRY